jgi:hypothetical protein
MSVAVDPVAMESAAVLGVVGRSVEVPIEEVTVGEGVRSRGLDESHVALLMEMAGQWPPIVLWGERNLVVDGAHRVAAARRLGHGRVAAVRFYGTSDEAFVESVRRNVDHGLPLSVVDRRRAARRVLGRHPEWSDRRIAAVCGLSGKTVARLRRDRVVSVEDTAVPSVETERRVGKDGKARPVRSGQVRERIQRALEENPLGSLRSIATAAGACPETVRSVRARLGAGDGQITLLPAGVAESIPEAIDARQETAGAAWESDQALLSSGDGGAFARWLSRNQIGDDWHPYVWTVPTGRIYEVVDEARRRAAAWTAFASLLECRVR